MEGWSSKWSWVERARTWDNHQEIRILEGRGERVEEQNEAQCKLVSSVFMTVKFHAPLPDVGVAPSPLIGRN